MHNSGQRYNCSSNFQDINYRFSENGIQTMWNTVYIYCAQTISPLILTRVPIYLRSIHCPSHDKSLIKVQLRQLSRHTASRSELRPVFRSPARRNQWSSHKFSRMNLRRLPNVEYQLVVLVSINRFVCSNGETSGLAYSATKSVCLCITVAMHDSWLFIATFFIWSLACLQLDL